MARCITVTGILDPKVEPGIDVGGYTPTGSSDPIPAVLLGEPPWHRHQIVPVRGARPDDRLGSADLVRAAGGQPVLVRANEHDSAPGLLVELRTEEPFRGGPVRDEGPEPLALAELLRSPRGRLGYGWHGLWYLRPEDRLVIRLTGRHLPDDPADRTLVIRGGGTVRLLRDEELLGSL